MPNKIISIVILTWNGVTLTRRCLTSLKLDNLPPHVEVIVVDNGSSDGTQKYVRGLPRVKLIENGKNLGYAKAVNIGIKAAAADADIVLLNNDVELIESNWLDRLATVADSDAGFGVVGVKILRDDETLQHCGAYLPVDTMWGQQLAGGEVDIGQYSGIIECESVVFACVYIKRSTLQKVGLLSEDFFAYFEDTDYCLRTSLAGLKVVMCGDIRIKHSENSSTKVNKVSHNDIFINSQKVFRSKWGKHLDETRYIQALDWHSIINFPSGYAGHRVVLWKPLIALAHQCGTSMFMDLVRYFRSLNQNIPTPILSTWSVHASSEKLRFRWSTRKAMFLRRTLDDTK